MIDHRGYCPQRLLCRSPPRRPRLPSPPRSNRRRTPSPRRRRSSPARRRTRSPPRVSSPLFQILHWCAQNTWWQAAFIMLSAIHHDERRHESALHSCEGLVLHALPARRWTYSNNIIGCLVEPCAARPAPLERVTLSLAGCRGSQRGSRLPRDGARHLPPALVAPDQGQAAGLAAPQVPAARRWVEGPDLLRFSRAMAISSSVLGHTSAYM